MKSNINFYRHDIDSHADPKFRFIRSKFGWAGEGRFWALNNLIAGADQCWLDLRTPKKRKETCLELEMTDEELVAFIEFLRDDVDILVRAKESELIVTTARIQEVFERVERDRGRKRAGFQPRSQKSEDVGRGGLPSEVKARLAEIARKKAMPSVSYQDVKKEGLRLVFA
jgi:hypothetical protein